MRPTRHQDGSRAHRAVSTGIPAAGSDFWRTADQALKANGELVDGFDRVIAEEKRIRVAELQGGPVPRTDATAQPPRFSGSPRDDDWQDDVNRRELLRLVAATGSLLAIPALDVDRVRHAEAHPRHLNSATLDAYEQLNATLWTRFAESQSKREVLPAVRQQLAILHASLKEPQTDHAQRRLCTTAGDLFQLCGEAFFDGGNYAAAAQCYAEAAHVSKEAREPDLWACAMTRHAFINIYEHQFNNAAPLLEGAAKLAVRGDPTRTTRYWIAAVQAQTYGDDAFSAVSRAESTADAV